jgi:hypothetical protein
MDLLRRKNTPAKAWEEENGATEGGTANGGSTPQSGEKKS